MWRLTSHTILTFAGRQSRCRCGRVGRSGEVHSGLKLLGLAKTWHFSLGKVSHELFELFSNFKLPPPNTLQQRACGNCDKVNTSHNLKTWPSHREEAVVAGTEGEGASEVDEAVVIEGEVVGEVRA